MLGEHLKQSIQWYLSSVTYSHLRDGDLVLLVGRLAEIEDGPEDAIRKHSLQTVDGLVLAARALGFRRVPAGVVDLPVQVVQLVSRFFKAGFSLLHLEPYSTNWCRCCECRYLLLEVSKTSAFGLDQLLKLLFLLLARLHVLLLAFDLAFFLKCR